MDAAVRKCGGVWKGSVIWQSRIASGSPSQSRACPWKKHRPVRPCRASASTASSTDKSRDHYDTLGVPKGSSQEAIKAAFRRLARKLHPDVAPSDPKTEGRFLAVLAAYQVLSDEQQRTEYDKELARHVQPPPVYHDVVWEPVANAHKQSSHSAKRAKTQADANHQTAPQEAPWKTPIHFRKPFAARQQSRDTAESPYPRDWRQSRVGGRARAQHARTAQAEEKTAGGQSQGSQSSADVADEGDDGWRKLWDRSISSAVQYGEARKTQEGRQEAMAGYLKAVQAKLASCWPPSLSLVLDALFVWLSMVLWSLYGTHVTLAWLSVVMLTNPHGGGGHKFATGVAWFVGGSAGLCLVVAMHATVWLAGHTNQHLAALAACCLLLAEWLTSMYPKLGSSAVALFVTRLWTMCA